MRCKFDVKYARQKYDNITTLELRSVSLGNCQRQAIGKKGFCILHDDEAWQKKPRQVVNAFAKAILRGENCFIGCHLPALRISPRKKTSLVFGFCNFHGDTEFYGVFWRLFLFESHFHHNLNLLNSQFDEIDCTNAEFQGKFEAHLYVHRKAWFLRAKFEYGALMDACSFQGDAAFTGAIFGRKLWGTDFTNTTFKGVADFSECAFREETAFYNTKFGSDVTFDSSRIDSPLKFNGSEFANRAEFRNITFPAGMEEPLMVLEDVTFAAEVSFAGSNVGYFSFLGTSLDKLKLDNVHWLRKGFRDVIASELQLRAALSLRTALLYSPDDVARAYRDLRKNFEDQRRHTQAGKFFIGEMEAERLRPIYDDLWRPSRAKKLYDRIVFLRNVIPKGYETSVRHKAEIARCLVLFNILAFIKTRLNLLSAYGVLSNYGESVWLTVLWSTILILAVGLVMSFPLPLRNLANSTFVSASIFLFAEQPRSALGLFERLFGILLMGVLLVALQRKYLRYQP